jgi:hypothetical protein
VRLQALHRASPQQLTLSVVKLEGLETGTEELCDQVDQVSYTLSARSLVKHPLKGNKTTGLHIVSAEPSEAPTEGQRSQRSESRRGCQCRETMLTGEILVSHKYPPGDLNPGLS